MASNVAGLHTPRLEARRGALKKVFSEVKMENAWQKYVRNGFRRQEVFDLFDHNDFHWNRKARFADLRRAILAGRFKPAGSMPVKVEKAFGVCRTIVIPSPEDAVVLQCIVENLLPQAIRKQPSRNTFFSRSHSKPTSDFVFDRDYIWFKQWRKFARLRINLGTAHRWVVTTDIATFFDNVRYAYLRNIISTFNGQHEVILDVLMGLLDDLCWRPDYVPSSQIGLPQVQFDAPRLLAHIYLFEIDAFLKQRCANQFVRWVDDMTIAVSSQEEGKCLLRDLDNLLQIRGLRLNSGKTRVLSAAEAAVHFQKAENDRFEALEQKFKKAKSANRTYKTVERTTGRSFRRFLRTAPAGHHDKVLKRYIGLAADMRSDFALKYLLDNFQSAPENRDVLYRYMQALGPRKDVFDALEAFLESSHALDDASVCHIAQVLTDWELVSKSPIFKDLQKLATKLCKPTFVRQNPHRFSAALALAAKYKTEAGLISFIRRSKALWSRSEYMSRQACAATGRVRDPSFLRECVDEIEGHAYKSAISVVQALKKLRSFTSAVPSDVRLYVLNGKKSSTYKLHRLLVSLVILRSPNLSPKAKGALKAEVLTYVTDPFYKALLSRC